MINANELRIGNWVEINWGSTIVYKQIKTLGINTLNLLMITKEDIPSNHSKLNYSSKLVNPIPLTHDILLKCGFKESKVPNDVERKMVDVMWIDAGYVQITYTMGETLLIAKNTSYESGQVILNKMVKYLHQLQNLYFALTGNELEIKF